MPPRRKGADAEACPSDGSQSDLGEALYTSKVAKDEDDDVSPSDSKDEADCKPSPPKRKKLCKSTENGEGSRAGSKPAVWSEADQITALYLMLGLDGDHTLTKRKQTVIANALGRTDKAVEHWWNTRTKKKVAETVARFAGKWSNFH